MKKHSPNAFEGSEEWLRQQINALPDNQRAEYYRLIRQRLRDPDTYVALNTFPIAGAHHFYLRHWRRGLFNLGLMVIALVLFGLALGIGAASDAWLGAGIVRLGSAVAGGLILAGLFVAELPALFRSQQIVRLHNEGIMKDTLAELAGSRATGQEPASGVSGVTHGSI